MTTQFEFRLIGAPSPSGELDADHLLALVSSLREVATRISRSETEAERLGRPPDRTRRVARLVIGLEPGSTRLLVRRAGAGEDALDFDVAEEQSFDEKFAAMVESIADDVRPSWIDDSLALAAGDVAAALQQAAPELEFAVDGQSRRRVRTTRVHRETWRPTPAASTEEITFVGRLFAVDVNAHRFRVEDDVGNRVALPHVKNDVEAAQLVTSFVTVTGTPQRDVRGRLTHLHDASIGPAPDPLGGAAVMGVVPLEETLRSAPGPDPDGGIELTDDEFVSFLEAARG